MTAVMNQTFQCTQVRLITFLSVQFNTGCSESTGRKTIESHICVVRSSDRVYFLVCAFSKSPLVSSEMALFCFFSGPPHQSQNTIETNMNEIKLILISLIPTQQIQVRFCFNRFRSGQVQVLPDMATLGQDRFKHFQVGDHV